MCQQLKVPRPSYYRWTTPKEPTPTQIRHNKLTMEVERVFGREKGMAGRDQITTILGHEGVPVAPGMAGAIMKKQGLRAVRMRAWKETTVVDPAARTGHIRSHMQDGDGNRDFTATVPGIRMVGDITYLHTGSGWLPRLGHPVRPALGPMNRWSLSSVCTGRTMVSVFTSGGAG
jgi:transposase InsO family protein